MKRKLCILLRRKKKKKIEIWINDLRNLSNSYNFDSIKKAIIIKKLTKN